MAGSLCTNVNQHSKDLNPDVADPYFLFDDYDDDLSPRCSSSCLTNIYLPLATPSHSHDHPDMTRSIQNFEYNQTHDVIPRECH